MNGSLHLEHLVISLRQFSDELFSTALKLAENHPCLLSLELPNLHNVNPAQENETHVERRRRLVFSKTILLWTDSVARLLDANQRLLSLHPIYSIRPLCLKKLRDDRALKESP
jgi:hypothetical protein